MNNERRGFGLIGLILLILLLAGIGLAISYFARHANRGSHWFQHSQLAYELADSGVKQALYVLSQRNSRELAGRGGAGGTAPLSVFEKLSTGGADGEILQLLSTDAPADLPPALKREVDALAAEFSPVLHVELRVTKSGPFWDGLLTGIPLQEGERKGVVRITSRASVQAPVGVRVERTLILEKGFRVVSLLPPVFGRFSLFLRPRGPVEPNVLSVRYDPATGDGVAEGGNPLILQSKFAAPVVTPGSRNLDRSGFLAQLADPKFLDAQGWVFLGAMEGGTAPWELKLAHGYGPAGESPLLDGDLRVVYFKGAQAEDQGFRKRFDEAFKANAMEGCESSLTEEFEQKEGLQHFVHGWASNYELIGMVPMNYELVQSGGARIAPQLGDGNSSALRLFGTPDRFSPTLVFGPVVGSTIRRASIECRVGPEAFCEGAGLFRFHLFNIAEHEARFQPVLQAAFGADYETQGTAVTKTPFIESLGVALSGEGSGTYAPDGILDRGPGGAGARTFASDHFPWVAQLGSAQGLPDADLTRILDGQLDAPRVYVGALRDALRAYPMAMLSKATFVFRPEAVATRMLSGPDRKKLSVPGIVHVMGEGARSTLVLPPDLSIERGGILINQGPIEIQGDIRRTVPTEPLTLVSMGGNITVGPNVRNLDAVLVATRGTVDVQASTLTVSGGIACRGLDFERIKAMNPPMVIRHAEETDPTGPHRAQSLRVFYGGDDRLIVTGSTP